MRRFAFYIAFFCSTLFSRCGNPEKTEDTEEQIALNLANNIDSNSINLLKEYDYAVRGSYDGWLKLSADTTLYFCIYKKNGDITELGVFNPLNFADDFASSFNFDTSRYNQFTFFQYNDTIIKILRIDKKDQEHPSDTLVATKQLFTKKNPFIRFSELTAMKDKLNFTGSSYRSDIGEFIVFWIHPYKLIYLPDTTKMNPHWKRRYWLDEFAKGKKIKEHWSLVKMY